MTDQLRRNRKNRDTDDDDNAGSSLDTFKLGVAPKASAGATQAVEAAAAQRVETELRLDLGTESGTREPNQEQAKAGNDAAGNAWNRRDDLFGSPHDGTSEDEGSPFDTGAYNTGKDRLASLIGDALNPASGGPAEHDPTGGRPQGSQPGSGSGGMGSGGASGPAPFGPKSELGAYGTDVAGTDEDSMLAARLASRGSAGEEYGFIAGRVADMSAVVTSPSVADGGLANAIEQAKTPEAQAAAANKAGVTPPLGNTAGGGAGESEPADDSEGSGETDTTGMGFVDKAANFVKSLGLPTNVSQAQQLQQVDDGIGVVGRATIGQQASEKSLGIKNLESAVHQTLGSAGGKNGVKDPGADPESLGGRPTENEMAYRQYLREKLNYNPLGPGEGHTDPVEEGPTSVDTSGPAPNFRQTGLGLFGQPGEATAAGSATGSVEGARMPGNMGNIDYGPDHFGQWTDNPRTEEPENALDGFGGSGLSISDARRNDDDDSEEEDDEDS